MPIPLSMLPRSKSGAAGLIGSGIKPRPRSKRDRRALTLRLKRTLKPIQEGPPTMMDLWDASALLGELIRLTTSDGYHVVIAKPPELGRPGLVAASEREYATEAANWHESD